MAGIHDYMKIVLKIQKNLIETSNDDIAKDVAALIELKKLFKAGVDVISSKLESSQEAVARFKELSEAEELAAKEALKAKKLEERYQKNLSKYSQSAINAGVPLDEKFHDLMRKVVYNNESYHELLAIFKAAREVKKANNIKTETSSGEKLRKPRKAKAIDFIENSLSELISDDELDQAIQELSAESTEEPLDIAV